MTTTLDRFRAHTGDNEAHISGPCIIKPYSAFHWSNGDQITEAEMKLGKLYYWTIRGHKNMTLCSGKRFVSSYAAEKWMSRQMGES